jgi:large subunit ribosomal protein L19
MDLIHQLEQELGKPALPVLHVGDTVEVHYLIREGDKERIQLFIGTVIAMKGRGIRKTITVRRIVQGEGVERVFPLHGPRVKDVTIQRRGAVRRSKLYYLRDRVGKGTRVDELLGEKARRSKQAEQEARDAIAAAEAAAQAANASDGEGEEA